MSQVRFDLFQDTLWPFAPNPANYLASWTRKISGADGNAWTGLFNSADGDETFTTLAFGSLTRNNANALTVDWNAAGDGLTIRTGLAWNDVKNILLDSFDGRSLTIQNLVDVLIQLAHNTTDQSVTIDGAKRGKIDLGSGNDTLFVGADSNKGGLGNDFHINTGAGNDTVTITRSTLDYSITAFRDAYAERFTNTFVELGLGNDGIVADGSNDQVSGGAGSDRAELRGGTNRFDGGADYDTVVFRGLKADYQIVDLGGLSYRVIDLKAGVDGDDGTTTFLNVEKAVFKDQDWIIAPPVNTAPDAVDDVYSVHAGQTLSITAPGILGNDTDADGDTLTVVEIIAAPSAGSLFPVTNGSFVYTPDENFVGQDSFTYKIRDGFGGFDTATVTINVTNAAPDAVNDVYNMRAGQTLNIAAPGILGNDTDADGDTLTVVEIIAAPSAGSLFPVTNGSFVYTPDENFVGQDSFTYKIRDGFGGFDTATVTINVTNAAPDAVNDVYNMRAGQTLNIAAPGILGNDTDADGDTLTVVEIIAAPSAGSLFPVTNGSFVYTPDENFVGQDSFTYKIRDGFGGFDTATVTINVTANTAPVAQDDTAVTTEDATLPIQIAALFNDSDPDGDAITVLSFTQGQHGTVTAGANLAYQPTDPNFNGTDSFTYTIIDAFGATATATVNVTVLPTNDAPVANDDFVIIDEDAAPILISPLGNDTDIDGDTLTLLSITSVANGTVQQNGNQVLYVPDANFNGSDQFTYQMFDQGGVVRTATVFITVNPANDEPVAVDDVYSVRSGEVLEILAPGFLGNDADPDGDAIALAAIIDRPTNGTFSVSNSGDFVYTPNAGFTGTDSFTYRIRDGFGGFDTATVTINVTSGNTPPNAVDDNFSTQVDAEITIAIADLLANDLDPGDTFFFTTAGAPVNGSLGQAGGELFFLPTAGFVGTASFEYTIQDSNGATDTATVSITVLPPPGPVAEDDSFNVVEDSANNTLTIFVNDTVPTGTSIDFGAGPANGTVSNFIGAVRYTPNADFSGFDSFTYTLTDAYGQSATATVTITVTESNDTPVLLDPGTFVGQEDGQIVGQINAFDADGDTLTFTGELDGLALAADGSFIYTPAANAFGIAAFIVTVSDGQGGVTEGAIFLQVNPEPDAPIARDDVTATLEDTEITDGNVRGNDTDADFDTLSFELEGPGLAGLTFNPDGTFSYAPPLNLNGVVSFDYRATDTTGRSDVATVTITIIAVPDAPVLGDDFAATAFETPVVINVLANDVDPDNTYLLPDRETSPANGSVRRNADDSFTYTPDPGFSGTDTFTYFAVNEAGLRSVATVTVTVAPPGNRPPVADDLSLTISEDTGFLINLASYASDPDSNLASFQVLGSTNLTVTSFNGATGILGGQPNANFNGTATITYQATDAGGLTDTGVVTITVTPVNDAPVAGSDSFAGTEDTVLTGDLTTNDFDVDGDGLTYTLLGGPYAGVVLDPNGSFTYTPPANFNGVFGFEYTVSDGQGGSAIASVTIDLAAANDAPVAQDDTASTAFQTAVIINVLGNDSDADLEALSPLLDSTPDNGDVVVNGDGTITYTPDAGFSGTDTFTYRAFDGVGFGNIATVTIVVAAPGNRPPVADDVTFTIDEDTPFVANLFGFTSDPDFNQASIQVLGTNQVSVTSFNGATGNIEVQPDANFSGIATITYQVTDAGGLTDTGVVTLIINPVNDAPVIGADQLTVLEDSGTTAGDLALNDSDADGDTLVYTLVESTTRGDLTLNEDGSFTYAPVANFQGFDSFRYTVTAGDFTSAVITVPITITSVNDAPVAIESISFGQENIARSNVQLLANDVDTLPQNLTWRVVGTVPDGLAVNPNSPNWEYISDDLSFSGDIVFTFEVDDGQGGTSQATHTIRILPENDRPTAVADVVTTGFETPITIRPLDNDSDEEGDAFVLGGVTSAANGTVTRDLATGEVFYTPNANFVGEDQILYRLSDAGGSSGFTGVITITVLPPPNRAPIAGDDTFTFGDDLGGFSSYLLGNDGDPDGDVVSISSFTQPERGSLTINAGSFTYITAPGVDTGPVTFTYTITDGEFFDTATVTLNVEDTTPILADDSYTVVAGQTLVVANPGVLANDPRYGVSFTTFDGFTQPTNGTVTFDPPIDTGSGPPIAGNFTYTPNLGFVGTDTFTYQVSTEVESVVATVTITVTPPPNSAPVASDFARAEAEDFPGLLFSLGALTNDSDGNATTWAITNVVGGTVTGFDASSGLGSFAPTANFNGEARIDWTVTDAGGLSDSASYVINVSPVDDGPVANTDFLTGNEDQALAFSIAAQLLANDTHPDGAAALAGTVFDGIESLGAGLLSVVPTGDTLTVTAAANFSGSTSFTYRVRDADGDTATATAFVNFLPAEDAPVANDDAFNRAAGSTQVLTFAQLFANDTDADNTNANPADNDVFNITAVTPISGISNIAINADQTLTLTYSGGPARFQYTLSDGTTTDTAVVTLNDAPLANDDAITILENVSWSNFHFVNVVGNDTDPNNDPLAVTAVNTTGTPITADLNGNQVRFFVNDPSNNTNGVFQISYTVSDGLGTDTGLITITVTPQNDAPSDPQGNDTALGLAVAEDGVLSISVAALLADDTQPADEAQVVTLAGVLNAYNGTVVNNGDGTLSFTPNANFNGTAGFQYIAEDEQGLDGAPVNVTITVTPVNDGVTANDDIIARQFQAGGTQTITRAQLLANNGSGADVDVDGDAVISAASIVSGITSLVLNADQSVTITYAAGALPVFSYTLSDGEFSDTATVTLNSGPQVTGTPGTLQLTEDTQAYLTDDQLIALAGVTDPNNDNLFIRSYGASPNISVNNWFFEDAFYTPTADFFGPTTLTFTISDGNAATDIVVTLNVAVAAVNDAPRDTLPNSAGNAGFDGVFAGTEETAITILKATLMADDVDPEGNSFFWDGASAYINGSITDNGDSITYTPFANRAGEFIGFQYFLEDAQGARSGPIYVTLNLANTPDPVVANDDVVLRGAGATQTVARSLLLSNDFDPDANETFTIVDLVANNGLNNVSLNAAGDVVVDYAGVGSGRASFTYTLQDSTGNTDTATVQLNRAPVATGEGTITISEGPDYVFIPYSTLLGNDTDPDGDVLTVQPWDWGYAGSNVTLSYSWFEGGQQGLRVILQQDEYTGPAEFQYRVYDGNASSNIVTVTLNVVAGDDAPEAIEDYWYYNGTQYGDMNPLTNDMVGTEDGVIEFPVSRLIEGQFINGTYQTGLDENDDGTLAELTVTAVSSSYGTAEIVDVGGVATVRFTPFADVNSSYGGDINNLDWNRVFINYTVSDGTQTDTARAYLLVLPEDDQPVANNDSFGVFGNGPWTLAIGEQGGAYDVRANDLDPDGYFSDQYSYSTIDFITTISGIANLQWDGFQVTVTADGSGDPIVFEYTLTDYDGDSSVAQVTLNPIEQQPVVFYFSGETAQYGRELWAYDPATYDENLGSAFATMVNEAETVPGSNSGNPLEITAVSSTVFWRADVFYDFGGESYQAYQWNAYSQAIGWVPLQEANVYAFDSALDFNLQNAGIRSGDYFWGATYGEGDTLTAWDQGGNFVAQVYLQGYDRSLLTDAGHDPAYAAIADTYLPETDTFVDAEQLFVALYVPNYGSWGMYRATDGGSATNDITEIAGLQVVQSGPEFPEFAKTLYFAGDFTDGDGIFREDALWRVTLTSDGYDWNGYQTPEWLDNGSGGEVALQAHDLFVTDVPLDGESVERLFHFGRDAAGNGQIQTQYFDYFGGSGQSTGTDFFGFGFEGHVINAWDNGVIFSGTVPGYNEGSSGAVVATYTDADGNGFFDLTPLFNAVSDGVIDILVVDGLGNAAWVMDDGEFDYLYVYRPEVGVISQEAIFGEITDVQMAEGHLVYLLNDGGPTGATLFDFNYLADTTLEVPTDEAETEPGDGYTNGYANTAIPGALVFEAFGGFGVGSRMFTTNGTDVFLPGGGFYRTSEGAVLNGNWVGTGYAVSTAQNGLYTIDAVGNLATLYTTTANVSDEAEVLGQKVLFGTTSAAANQVLVHDAATGTTTTLLGTHLLGAASTVGSNIIFNALDFTAPANTDGTIANNVWTLYAYDGTTLTELMDLPTGAGGGQHVYEWTGQRDFLGNDDRIYWKQANDSLGTELHTINLNSADPAGTLTVADVFPGVGSGANWGDAVFANGRIYWQASADSTGDLMRLWTTTDGTDAEEVTGFDLLDPGYQFPWLPAVIGNEVFFMGNSNIVDGTGTWAVYQVNDDGVTATRITPDTTGYVYGLAAIGTDLYFIEAEDLTDDGVDNAVDQIWRLTPSGDPAGAGAPVAMTAFADQYNFMSDLFGANGQVFFSRDDGLNGQELWVLDASQATGARMVDDFNTENFTDVVDYFPEQVVAAPNPLESMLAGSFFHPGIIFAT